MRVLVGRFEEGDDGGGLPDGGDVSFIVGVVEQIGEEGETGGTQMLELMDC